MQKISHKTALITGASRGIGYAAAIRLAAEGFHIIAVARSQKGLEALDDEIKAAGGSATLVQLDLREFEKITALAQMIVERFGKLDVLVGNAGILGEITPLHDASPEEWHKTIDVNLHANYHLIRNLHPLLLASPHGRVIMVTSGAAVGAMPYWGAYAVSKAALESMVLAYAAENTKTNLRINLLDPARNRTRMRAQAFPGEDPDTLPTPESISHLFVEMSAENLQKTGTKFYAKPK